MTRVTRGHWRGNFSRLLASYLALAALVGTQAPTAHIQAATRSPPGTNLGRRMHSARARAALRAALLPSSTPGTTRWVHASSGAAQQGTASRSAASAGKPSPAGSGRGGKSPAQLKAAAAATFDFTKPFVPRHQVVFTPAPPSATAAAPGAPRWSPESRRVGTLALKCGMTADWDKWGVRRALTVLRLEDVIVTATVSQEERGYTALQVGAALPKLKNLNKPLTGTWRSAWRRASSTDPRDSRARRHLLRCSDARALPGRVCVLVYVCRLLRGAGRGAAGAPL